MNVWLFIERVRHKLLSVYRRHVFRAATRTKHKDIKIYGPVYLINRRISCGRQVALYPGVQFFGDGPIVIGDHVSIGNGTLIYASRDGGVTIGSDTQIAAHCYLIDTNHGTAAGQLIREQPNSTAPVSIGQDVWLGAGCKVIKGATIGDGAVVGAMSLVNRDIPEHTVAVGCPAQVIRQRQ